jgi:hypothetical protein
MSRSNAPTPKTIIAFAFGLSQRISCAFPCGLVAGGGLIPGISVLQGDRDRQNQDLDI